MVIHAVLLDALHEQPLGEVTTTAPVPPAEGSDSLVGEIAYVQGAAA